MNRKAIKSVLKKEYSKWLESIENEEIRKVASKKSFVTGGAIVSLLQNEKPNDLDIYFTDQQAAVAVAGYYADEWNKAHPEKNHASVKVDGERVRVFIQSHGITEETPTDDDEMFQFGDQGYADENEPDEEADKPPKKKYRPVFLSSNAITLSDGIQLVLRFYGSPAEVHKNYDFVHCTCYYVPSENELVLPAEALEAIINKELKYVGSKYPLASIIRTRKFINRGWKVNAGQYLKMCLQLNELDLMNLSVLEDQLTGVDMAYFAQVISSVQQNQIDNPDFKFDSMYLVEVINRIFD